MNNVNALQWLTATLVFTTILAFSSLATAQSDSLAAFHFKGFVDSYYSYDFNKPADHVRQPFLYNHNRHNEFNVNLALLHAAYAKKGIRANLGIIAGTYPQDNYAAEEDLLRNIYEANVGVALNKDHTLWLDAGILPSHIGFESAISTDNLTLTRSLAAENSPYFLSGAKLSWDMTSAWSLSALVINGWQRIARPEANQKISIGTQLNFHPSERLSINWSTFIGSDAPDSLDQIRVFNNFYLQAEPVAGFQLIAGFDVGTQKTAKPLLEEGQSDDWQLWYTPVMIGRLALSEHTFLGARAEYYSDPKGVIITYGAPEAFQTLGFSANVDYYISENALFRIEGRHFQGRNPVFHDNGGYTTTNTFLTASLAIEF